MTEKYTPPPLPAHLVWNEHTVPGWPKPAPGVATGAPWPDHVAFCCGSAHNCLHRDKSCAMRGDVLGREHERGRSAGVALPDGAQQ